MRRTYFIAFWNVENLFAPQDYDARLPWLARVLRDDLAGWTGALFERKLDQLALIIARLNDGNGPDLLGVCEVENSFVLEQLIARLAIRLPERRYAVIHADSERDRRGIDTAFLYDAERFVADPALVFSHWVMRRTGTRDITQATFVTEAGHELIALVNHWPSRSGGTYESRSFRNTAGETLGYWHQRIWDERGRGASVVVLGDFNDDPFDESLCRHAGATRERGDVVAARVDHARFYNLAWNYLRQPAANGAGEPRTLHGTLYFEGNGNVFDQILVARGLLLDSGPLRVRAESARIEAFAELIGPDREPAPRRFGLPRGNATRNVDQDGFSDHYPVSVLIDER